MLTVVQKQEIRNLRAGGSTYNEIRQKMGQDIPRSSLSYICKDIQMDSSYHKKVKKLNKEHLHRVRSLAIRHNQQIRQTLLDEIDGRANQVIGAAGSLESLKLALAMLYLGEGSKWKSHRGLSLGNSNPEIVSLYVHLLKECYGINIDSLRARVQCRADQDTGMLEKYWSELLGISRNQFYKSGIDKRTQGKPRIDMITEEFVL